MKHFVDKLKDSSIGLIRENISTLQVNMGKLCNQACSHCHVEAGPKRSEMMNIEVISQIINLLKRENNIKVVDITGGAPELNNHFKYFVTELKKLNFHVIDRCNLTVLHEKGQEDTPEFLANNNIEIVASLPCYTEENVDKQRGKGVFSKSIDSLKMLNKLGYGKGNDLLKLNLVYNPLGDFLALEQGKLVIEYKELLRSRFQIYFDNLFSLNNMPIKRFNNYLKRNNRYEKYMDLLYSNFNSQAALNIMCKSLISISWDGLMYDCDFNQMLDITVNDKKKNIFQISSFKDVTKNISTNNHCYGCTAGSGSSCGGSLV